VRIRKDLEYALISLLAMEDMERVVSSRELAEGFNIPLNLLRKIFHQLNRSGVISAVRGPKGGFRLERTLERITLQEVVEALSGQVGLVACLQSEACNQVDTCNIRRNMTALQDLMSGFLSSLTVEQFGRLQYDRNVDRSRRKRTAKRATARVAG
jgi:Rrf2 family protein